jgi:hypothetical protein
LRRAWRVSTDERSVCCKTVRESVEGLRHAHAVFDYGTGLNNQTEAGVRAVARTARTSLSISGTNRAVLAVALLLENAVRAIADRHSQRAATRQIRCPSRSSVKPAILELLDGVPRSPMRKRAATVDPILCKFGAED